MNNDKDRVFELALKILTDNQINYWVCHGTLLGIIRDNKLLEWDSDIDFALWDDEYSKEDVLKVFSEDERFKLEFVPEEIDSLHFSIFGNRVDINFYTRDNEKAFIKWSALPKNYLFRIVYFIIEFISTDKSIKKSINFKNKKFIPIIKILLIIPFLIFKLTLTKSIKAKIFKNMSKKLNLIGYSFPMELMRFKFMKFLNHNIVVPVDSEKVLKHTYGDSWNIPKKNYVWYEEANNLFKQN